MYGLSLKAANTIGDAIAAWYAALNFLGICSETLGFRAAAGGFRLAQYGPMYSLKPRKNELLLRVSL